MDDAKSMKEFVLAFGQQMMDNYWNPIYKKIEENPELLKNVTGFLKSGLKS